MQILYFLLAFAAGLGISVQAAVNGRLGVSLGGQPGAAALISFAVGAIFLLLAMAFITDWPAVFQAAPQQPWWRWTGGLLGAIFVFTSIFLAPRIGVTNTMFLFILGQLTMGMLIDRFGLLEMPVRAIFWWKYAGLGVMLAGLGLFMFGEKWFNR